MEAWACARLSAFGAAALVIGYLTAPAGALDWQQATAAANWPGRVYHTTAVHDGKLWIMGGYTSENVSDVWYSTGGAAWTLATSSPGWQARHFLSSAAHAGKLWVLGGNTDGGTKNDVWCSEDGIVWTEAASSAPWGPRHDHATLVHASKIWILGGSSSRNDIWSSTDGSVWLQATAAASWPGRSGHAALIYAGKMWVMAGGANRDIWHSIDGMSWTQATEIAAWSGRTGPASIDYEGRIWLMGGGTPDRVNDVWYSTDGAAWTQETAQAPWSARQSQGVTLYGGKLWLIGGDVGGGLRMNDVWFVAPPDADGDGIPDDADNCPNFANLDQADGDSDGVGDACDGCPADSNKIAPGLCGCNVAEDDSDSDGTPDCLDECPGYPDNDDCNNNTNPDGCDIAGGSSMDACPGDGVPDECQSALWQGSDGALFGEYSNWSTGAVPDSGTPVAIVNETPDDNRCVLNVPGITAICGLLVEGVGGGLQFLSVAPGSGLRVASVFENLEDGAIRADPLSQVLVNASTIVQEGELDIRAGAGMAFDAALSNVSGGSILLFGGVLSAANVSNQLGAILRGFGTVNGNTSNDGEMIAIADTQIVGNLINDGTIIVQSGLLTITGDLSGSGVIIGGFGGRDGDSTGLNIHGDFLPAVTDWRQLNLTHSTLQLDGDPAGGPQHLEVMGADRGAGVTLPDGTLYSIGTLRIGPSATTVQLLDHHDNKGVGSRSRRTREAIYVQHLILDPGVTLDLGGLRLYYETVSPESPLAEGSGVSVIDSVGGGELIRVHGRRRGQ